MNNADLIPNTIGDKMRGELPSYLQEANIETGSKYATYILERLEDSSDRFSSEIFPKKTRRNAALVGAFPSHKRNHLYSHEGSLQSLMEKKINGYNSKVAILAVNSRTSYYAFETNNFSYSALEIIRNLTGAEVFLAFISNPDIMIVFYEDSPSCFISYKDCDLFIHDFGKHAKLRHIFLANRENWKVTTLNSEHRWLNKVSDFFY